MLRTYVVSGINTVKRSSQSGCRYIYYSRQRFHFSDNTKDYSEDKSDLEENKTPSISFTESELKKSPLAKSTYLKLLQNMDKDSTSAFTSDLDLMEKSRTQIKNLNEEVKSLKKISEQNRESLTQLKTLVENERSENTRLVERMTREVEKEKVFAISNFSKEVLEIVDNLDRVLAQSTNEQDSNVYKGVQLVKANALSVLKRFGITPLENPLEQQVNLEHHEIVFHAPYPGKPDGYILDVSQAGYLIGERVLRPAKVGVVKNM